MTSLSHLEKGRENELAALHIIHRFGWLRPQEIGRYIWLTSKHFEMYGVRLGIKLQKDELVLARKLPRHRGTALVLSKKGAERLRENGVDNASTGKDIGSTDEYGFWTPRKTWEHDLLCSSALILIQVASENKILFKTEAEFRADQKFFSKAPDGMLINTNSAIWIEVENAKKTGKEMDHMVKSAITLLTRRENYFDVQLNHVAFVYPQESKDYRSYPVDHKKNIINAFKRNLNDYNEVQISFIEVRLKNGAVSKFRYSSETITSEEFLKAAIELGKASQSEEGYEYFDDAATGLIYHCAYITKSQGEYQWEICPEYRQIDIEGGFEEVSFSGSEKTRIEALKAIARAVKDELEWRKGLPPGP